MCADGFLWFRFHDLDGLLHRIYESVGGEMLLFLKNLFMRVYLNQMDNMCQRTRSQLLSETLLLNLSIYECVLFRSF